MKTGRPDLCCTPLLYSLKTETGMEQVSRDTTQQHKWHFRAVCYHCEFLPFALLELIILTEKEVNIQINNKMGLWVSKFVKYCLLIVSILIHNEFIQTCSRQSSSRLPTHGRTQQNPENTQSKQAQLERNQHERPAGSLCSYTYLSSQNISQERL